MARKGARMPVRYPRMTLTQFASFMSTTLPNDVRNNVIGFSDRVAAEIYRGVLTRWPVRTGYSRSNWTPSVGSGVSDPHSKHRAAFAPRDHRGRFVKQNTTRYIPAKSSDVMEAMSVFNKAGIDKSRHISNPVDYAKYVEFDGGSSRRQGRGVARLAINSVMARVNTAKNTNMFIGTGGQ